MMTAAAVALVVAALVAGALAMPVEVEIDRPGRGLPTSVRVDWLAGRVSREFAPGAEEPAPEKEEEAEERVEEEREGPGLRGPGPARALAAVGTPGLPSAVGRLLSRLASAMRLRLAAATIRLADPADTGRLWGLVGSGTALLPAAWRSRLDLRPDFSPGDAEVTGRLAARLVPLRLLGAVVAFLLSPAVLRAGWRAARAG